MTLQTNSSRSPARFVEVAGTDLDFRPLSISDDTPTGRQILSYCDLHPHADYIVLQWLPGGDIEEVRLEEQVDFSDGAVPRLIVARADRVYRLQLNERSLIWPADIISLATLSRLGRIPVDHSIFVRHAEGDKRIDAHHPLELTKAGVEVLYSRTESWKLNVQGVTIESASPNILVRDAMAKAGFDVAAGWIVVLKTAAERRQVGLDDIIDLTLPGIEKLRLTPREINNGETACPPTRDFALLAADAAGLDERGLRWRTIVEAGRRWLMLDEVPLPVGFNVARADIAIEIPISYPAAELDMFYCHPSLSRLDGREIPQTQVPQPLDGRTFQRWSRHRGVIAPWRAGVDSILTHLTLIDAALVREVEQ